MELKNIITTTNLCNMPEKIKKNKKQNKTTKKQYRASSSLAI